MRPFTLRLHLKSKPHNCSHVRNDDLAQGKMVASLFIARLIESPEQFLEDVVHLDIRYGIGVQINLAELEISPGKEGRFCRAGQSALQTRSASLSLRLSHKSLPVSLETLVISMRSIIQYRITLLVWGVPPIFLYTSSIFVLTF